MRQPVVDSLTVRLLMLRDQYNGVRSQTHEHRQGQKTRNPPSEDGPAAQCLDVRSAAGEGSSTSCGPVYSIDGWVRVLLVSFKEVDDGLQEEHKYREGGSINRESEHVQPDFTAGRVMPEAQ